jgi:DNA-directed RNA polymerase subunit RPC12/RpoP
MKNIIYICNKCKKQYTRTQLSKINRCSRCNNNVFISKDKISFITTHEI